VVCMAHAIPSSARYVEPGERSVKSSRACVRTAAGCLVLVLWVQ
jgi:hypothetical protein